MGEQWRPHSADEAAWFQGRYCDRCEHDAPYRDGSGDSCPIAAQGFGVAIGLDPPPQWQADTAGPHCTDFKDQAQ